MLASRLLPVDVNFERENKCTPAPHRNFKWELSGTVIVLENKYPYNKLLINLACLVCTEKSRALVLAVWTSLKQLGPYRQDLGPRFLRTDRALGQ